MRKNTAVLLLQNQQFIANDVNLGKDTNGMVLYGLNASGKSSYGRQIGLSIIMAQAGFYVAAETFHYKPYKNIVTKIAIKDNLYKGRSTYINEMDILRNILDFTDNNSLVIADELCSGTETPSAIGIAASTIIDLSKKNASFIFMTHYHEIMDIDEIKQLNNVKEYHMDVDMNTKDVLIYNRTLKPGRCPKRYGIEIASHMGLNSDFISRALKFRLEYEGDESKLITSTKTSRYNSDIYMDYCKICNGTSDLHAHHIVHQKDFNVDGACIPFEMNSQHNLVVVCKQCHQDIHKNLVKVHGYKQTTKGVIFDFEKLKS